jgi:chemotaxis family two-component system sensor histidine kinase/response regulator PixL
MPKVLEVFEAVSTQALPVQIQSSLLLQQVQWMQFWSQFLDLRDLKTLSDTTLNAFEAFPQAIIAIAQVALAGFQVAHEATIQRLALADQGLSAAPEQPSIRLQRPLWPSEQALEAFNTGEHLVGLAHQTIFCVATESIEEIALLEPSQLRCEDEREQIIWRDRQLTLHQFIDLWQPIGTSTPSRKEPKTSALVLILKHESKPLAVALNVDRLIVEPELKLERPDGASHPCCYGLTVLNEGASVEVVDVNCLLWEHSAGGLSLEQPADGDRLASAQAIKPTAKALSVTEPVIQPVIAPLQPKTVPKTILIVDDSRTVREMLTLTLKDAGYSVLQAQDGHQAIEHLQRQADIHLTICDIEMSNLNGFEFLRHRLQDPRWGHIPVLILSSHTDPEYRQLAQKLGAADYFTIPYENAALIQSIENLL